MFYPLPVVGISPGGMKTGGYAHRQVHPGQWTLIDGPRIPDSELRFPRAFVAAPQALSRSGRDPDDRSASMTQSMCSSPLAERIGLRPWTTS